MALVIMMPDFHENTHGIKEMQRVKSDWSKNKHL